MNDNTLESVLDALVTNCHNYYVRGHSTDFAVREIDIAKQQLTQMVKEIIGSSKKWDVSKEDYGFRDQGKAELRREQVERARKYGLEIE